MKSCTRALVAAVPACALASAAPAGIMLGQNLLNNNGAEAGPGGSGQVVPVPGWSVTEGLFTVGAYDTAGLLSSDDPGPANRGANYFLGGGAARSVAEQRYNLFPLAGQVDAGLLSFTLDGWLGTIPGEDDTALLTVTFLDAGKAEIGTFGTGTGPKRGDISAGGLGFFATGGVIPTGAREAVVELIFDRFNDSGLNDGSADELSFVILPAPGSAALLALSSAVAGVRRRR